MTDTRRRRDGHDAAAVASAWAGLELLLRRCRRGLAVILATRLRSELDLFIEARSKERDQ